MDKSFSSKLMLFGEYGVIKGAQAVIMPFDTYQGHLEVTQLDSDLSLWKLLESLQKSRILSSIIDLELLEKDIREGLRFISSIPQGMGLGSSGALCAAIYDKYKKSDDLHKDLSLLQEYLSIIESHFHGKSSGIDPLVSFIDKSLWVKKDQSIELTQKPLLGHFGKFFLYNSRIQRQTAPLVHHFLKDYENPALKPKLDRYMSLSDACIQNLFDFDKESFLDNFIELSHLQLKYFKNMIPQHIEKVWKEGLDKGKYFFKLCGAGGGGFFLCYSNEVVDLEACQLIS